MLQHNHLALKKILKEYDNKFSEFRDYNSLSFFVFCGKKINIFVNMIIDIYNLHPSKKTKDIFAKLFMIKFTLFLKGC